MASVREELDQPDIFNICVTVYLKIYVEVDDFKVLQINFDLITPPPFLTSQVLCSPRFDGQHFFLFEFHQRQAAFVVYH